MLTTHPLTGAHDAASVVLGYTSQEAQGDPGDHTAWKVCSRNHCERLAMKAGACRCAPTWVLPPTSSNAIGKARSCRACGAFRKASSQQRGTLAPGICIQHTKACGSCSESSLASDALFATRVSGFLCACLRTCVPVSVCSGACVAVLVCLGACVSWVCVCEAVCLFCVCVCCVNVCSVSTCLPVCPWVRVAVSV